MIWSQPIVRSSIASPVSQVAVPSSNAIFLKKAITSRSSCTKSAWGFQPIQMGSQHTPSQNLALTSSPVLHEIQKNQTNFMPIYHYSRHRFIQLILKGCIWLITVQYLGTIQFGMTPISAIALVSSAQKIKIAPRERSKRGKRALAN